MDGLCKAHPGHKWPSGNASRTLVGWVMMKPNQCSRTGAYPVFGYRTWGHRAQAYAVCTWGHVQNFKFEMYSAKSTLGDGDAAKGDYGILISMPLPLESRTPFDVWQHVAFMHDKDGGQNKAYINGTVVNSGTPSPRPNTPVGVHGAFAVGGAAHICCDTLGTGD
ncbi:unnamed protein product [Amoebophrya sp. A25]|nr:unnamed protein product [Amoebophrya sp. A25]|eukprot:GSA25T00009874001.1